MLAPDFVMAMANWAPARSVSLKWPSDTDQPISTLQSPYEVSLEKMQGQTELHSQPSNSCAFRR